MAKLPFLKFVGFQFRKIPAVPDKDLSGKTIVITGANAGLGFEATKHIARMNPGRLIMACRNESKGKAAIAELVKVTGYNKAELWLLDQSTFASVSAFATKFEKDGGRLDVLMMNAGITLHEYIASPDGYESLIQTNHLSTSLLPLLLTPVMARTAREHGVTPRVVVVTSEMHYWTPITKETYDRPDVIQYLGSKEYCTKKGVMPTQYNLSKLLEIMFARSWATKYTHPQSIVYTTVNPGWCYSNVLDNLSLLMRTISAIMMAFLALTAEQGSRMLVRSAVCEDWEFARGDEVKGDVRVNGAYLNSERVDEPADEIVSEEGGRMQENVWKDTVHILSKADPRVAGIVREYFAA